MPLPLENSQVVGPYYPDRERAHPDPDAAYDAMVQYQLDHPETQDTATNETAGAQ